MAAYEFLEILRTFSESELVRFSDFLMSPYFNRRDKLQTCFELIAEHKPLFTDLEISTESLARKLYPGKANADSTVLNLISDLHAAALSFLTYENFSRSGAGKYRFLFNDLNKKHFYGKHEKIVESFTKENEHGIDYDYFLNLYFSETNKFNFSYLNERVSKKRNLETEIETLEKTSTSLFYFFFIELINDYLTLLIYSRQYNIDISKSFQRKLIDKVISGDVRRILPEGETHSFVIELFTSLLMMYDDFEDESRYFSYKTVLFKHLNELSVNEINSHYIRLVSYCIAKVQKEDYGGFFGIELFKLYKEMLENSYYKSRNSEHLPHELFRSVLLHGLRLKEYEWTASFIEEYSRKVHPNDTDNMYHFGNAYLNYNTGNFTRALDDLNQIEEDFYIYKFDVKNLTLMIYFELGYTEEALYLIKTYLEFLRRNTLINSEKKKRYFSFVKFTEKLIMYKSGMQNIDLGYVRYRIQRHKKTAFKPWLLEKILALETGMGKAV